MWQQRAGQLAGRGDCGRPDTAGSWRYLPRSMYSGAPNSRRSAGGSNSAAIWASVSCCRRISRISPEVKTGRPADPGQGVDERAAPEAKDAANRGLHGAAVDAELDTLSLADFRGPAPARSRFVRLCYKNCPFVSSGQNGRSLARRSVERPEGGWDLPKMVGRVAYPCGLGRIIPHVGFRHHRT
jgi:hypothetical protein